MSQWVTVTVPQKLYYEFAGSARWLASYSEYYSIVYYAHIFSIIYTALFVCRHTRNGLTFGIAEGRIQTSCVLTLASLTRRTWMALDASGRHENLDRDIHSSCTYLLYPMFSIT
jgi:hypothetical protein